MKTFAGGAIPIRPEEGDQAPPRLGLDGLHQRRSLLLDGAPESRNSLSRAASRGLVGDVLGILASSSPLAVAEFVVVAHAGATARAVCRRWRRHDRGPESR
jgi:hypothetical protein